jgi:two-component system, OmpR family, phosphate regulon sensor histidine kinase PhoR
LNAVYRHAAGWLAGISAAGFVAGLVFGDTWGWRVLALGLVLLLAYHLRNLGRLAGWIERPVLGRIPEASGIWDEVLAGLHRFERAAARHEEELTEALARFRRAVQALPDGVLILDAANRIEWCNRTAETHLQIDARRDVGQPVADLVRDPQFVEYLAGDDVAAPVRVERGDRAIVLQVVAFGRLQRLLLSRDVTQAERVETMRRDFVANVSHELRTPLTVLVGFLETVRDLPLDAQRVRDYIGMMSEQAARMQRIIGDLLTLSTLESAPPPTEDRVPIAPLLERLRADAEALSAGRHEISVSGTGGHDVMGSESELYSAFSNLVSNAIRYTPAKGKVRLLWHDDEDGARFCVEDTGVGIAPEHIPRLTERFYRVDRGRSRETGGTGLGLAIVKHALARHHAILDIESRPGAGSRFTARFPPQRLLPRSTGVKQPG